MTSAKKTVKLTQTGATHGNKPGVRETLLGLGLGRIRATRELEDTPSIRGMIFKVRHIVSIEEPPAAADKPAKTAKK